MSANNNSSDSITCESAEDKQLKKILLINTIGKKFTSSHHDILQQISQKNLETVANWTLKFYMEAIPTTPTKSSWTSIPSFVFSQDLL